MKYTGFHKNTRIGSVSSYFRKYLLLFLGVQLYTSEKKKKETFPLKGFYTVTSYDMELVV